MLARYRTLHLLGIIALAGCADLAQHRLDKQIEEPPQAAPPLHIPGPPTAATPVPPDAIKPVAFRPAPAQDAAPAAPSAGNPLRALYQKADQRHQTMDAYVMRLRRREVVGGKVRPEELILVKIRQQPWSVYFKWLGPEAKGREVVYVKGQPGNEIHTLTAAGDVPLLPAGQRFSVAADSAMVKARSRYPITEAGLGTVIRRFGELVEAAEKGDRRAGTFKYLGRVKRPEFDQAVEGVEQLVPPESDPRLPKGGRRWWYFDAASGLPVLIVTNDETGREVEYYCHDRIQCPARLDDDDFNPDRLWKKAAPAPGGS
jgi:hypothetical protein